MPRNIDSTLLEALASPNVALIDLVMLTFRSKTCYVWSGVGSLTWNGNVFTGVGSMGGLGDVTESTDLKANGTFALLSGIDPTYLAESLTDIRLGAPAMRWLGAVQQGSNVLIGTPYLLFSGQVDKPTNYTGPDTLTIKLALESRMINHARASNRRYTTNDQHANGYPDDTAFNRVELCNDIALPWGT